MTDALLTSAEVCRRLGVCLKTLQIMRRRHKIAFIRLGHRTIRFHEADLQQFLKDREKAASEVQP